MDVFPLSAMRLILKRRPFQKKIAGLGYKKKWQQLKMEGNIGQPQTKSGLMITLDWRMCFEIAKKAKFTNRKMIIVMRAFKVKLI